MTTPLSGPIGLLDIQNEFGGAAPTGINEYYAGGGLVPNPTSGNRVADFGPVATSGPINIGSFYGTQAVIVGNTGIITTPAENAFTSDFVDVTLPAGVNYIRFYLVGGGGGGGGRDTSPFPGGNGGGGSSISGTISTAWAGSVNQNRILRFFIGRAGAPGPSNVGGNSFANPAPRGGHGYPLAGHTSGSWSAWLNNYAVSWDQAGTSYPGNDIISDRMIYFPTTGSYQFQFEADNHLRIFGNGFQFANTYGSNDQGYNADTSYNLASPLTRSTTFSQGWSKVRFQFTNSASVGSFGVRIVNASTSAEIWNTRNDYATSATHCYPAGGNGGYSGSTDTSGYGGAGGSATKLTLVMPNGSEYLIAIAGGGAGGGGGGLNGASNVSPNGNWATQGWIASAFPTYATGNEGEYVSYLNGASSYPPALDSDGGGGGGGGGGILNDRIYPMQADRQWRYSGFGGRTKRGNINNGGDRQADGGESGKSAVTSFAATYADFVHAPTTNQFVNLPAMPVSVAGYGQGGPGGSGASPASVGINGVGYVDWGTTSNTVGAVSISRSSIRAGVIPYDTTLTNTGVIGTSGATIEIGSTSASGFTADAWGGGGNPGSEYSYSWSSIAGGATFNSPNSYRTYVNTGNGVGSTGVIRCTVSDGVSSAVADMSWEVYDDTSTPGGGGDGDGDGGA